jgi:hypothetical protein
MSESDLDDIEAAISNAADKIVTAINKRTDIPTFLGYVLVGWLLFWQLPSLAWHSKARYSFQYQTDFNRISISKMPHNCDFLAAPLGAKYCHYERTVSTVRWATSAAGEPIVSYDEGKTWTVFTPENPQAVPKGSTIQSVVVSWVKKDED